MPAIRLTGAQAVVRCLELENVQYVFGHPGGAILPIYDALYHSKSVKHILVRHEQAGAHMAEGFARATGKVGVCMATSGPGATNLVTGILDAFMDSVPLVAITGNVALTSMGTDAFQEADIVGITMPITKHNWLIERVEDIPRIMKEAFYVAQAGRPGPVLVDVPKDLQIAEFDFIYPDNVNLPVYPAPFPKEPSGSISDAVALIRKAQRPVIYVGGGIHPADAHAEVLAFAELLGAPVVTTVHGKGGFPEEHRLSLGMFGMHGTRFANNAIQNSDLIVALGARFDDRVTGKISAFAPRASIVHLDIDPAELSKVVNTAVPLVGNLKAFVPRLTMEVGNDFKQHGSPSIADWWTQLDSWKEKHALRYRQDPNGPILPQKAIDTIYQRSKGQAIVTTGVGEHQMFAAQFYRTNRARQFISSGGAGTMGFCLPAAIGAQLGRPGELVIGIDGDGSFQMTLQDLATAVKLELPIKIFIINNMYLGMVRQWQEIFYSERYSESLLGDCPDFVKLAEAYGCLGLRAIKLEELDSVIDRALAHTGGPTIIDIRVKETECCYPMVSPGAPLDQMVGGE